MPKEELIMLINTNNKRVAQDWVLMFCRFSIKCVCKVKTVLKNTLIT